ncbi:MAG: flagellar basal-body rod protein FlgG [Proteobacteria bacterium]|jgi:flagellar basal-body rod protein FlgG|nr:flagellar basal-body rod protein FlgG [Pseudomonadota bacterium]
MEAALWVAKTGLDAQQTRMTVIANNLANVNTTGFKRDRATFEDLLYQNVRQGGAQTSADTAAPTGLLLGTGTRVVSTEKLHAQGNLIQTQNAFDLAISGEGFFQILQPDGTIAYTRDGGFKVSGEGVLVNSSGYRLQPELAIPQNAQTITIGADGTVSIQAFGEAQAQTIGQIQLARFLSPTGLQAIGENLFRETTSSGPPQVGIPSQQGNGQLIQGALESSNVNVVEEMVSMIETQRAYEVNSKAIEAVDGMLRFANNNLG